MWESNDRCNQENLIAQLKSGVHALETPLDNLESNWAYMVMASLAWNLKAWFGLSLPEKGRWASKYKIEKRAVIEMEFKTFVNAFIRVPAQIIRQGRKTIYRLRPKGEQRETSDTKRQRKHGQKIQPLAKALRYERHTQYGYESDDDRDDDQCALQVEVASAERGDERRNCQAAPEVDTV